MRQRLMALFYYKTLIQRSVLHWGEYRDRGQRHFIPSALLLSVQFAPVLAPSSHFLEELAQKELLVNSYNNLKLESIMS